MAAGAFAAVAGAAAFGAGALAGSAALDAARSRRRTGSGALSPRPKRGIEGRVIALAVEASRRASTQPGKAMRAFAAISARAVDRHARLAGVEGQVTAAGAGAARVDIALALALAGAAVGLALSPQLAALAAVAGVAAGWASVPWALRARQRARSLELERHLPEMLDVVALGLRSGLSFDRSLELYASHFDTLLAQSLGSARQQWSLGLSRRDDALRAVASTYDSPLFARTVEGMVRSLRFGSSLAEGLDAAAGEARAQFRARRQEQVAKAPVKMMVPVGALMLPAMLLLVLGPVLLELMGGF